ARHRLELMHVSAGGFVLTTGPPPVPVGRRAEYVDRAETNSRVDLYVGVVGDDHGEVADSDLNSSGHVVGIVGQDQIEVAETGPVGVRDGAALSEHDGPVVGVAVEADVGE